MMILDIFDIFHNHKSEMLVLRTGPGHPVSTVPGLCCAVLQPSSGLHIVLEAVTIEIQSSLLMLN